MKQFFFMVLLVFGAVTQAGATIIDFDNTLPTYFGLDTYSEDGYTLTSNVPAGTLIDNNNLVRSNLWVLSAGTNSQTLFWGENNVTSTISIANDLGNSFYLKSLDTSSMGNPTGQLVLTGTLFAGGTVNKILNVTGDLTSYNIFGMGELASLDISFDGSTYAAPFDLDNITVSAIPIPAAVWLFGSGLGLLGWFGRSQGKPA